MRRIAATVAALAGGVILTAAIRHLATQASSASHAANASAVRGEPLVGQWRIETLVELGGQSLPSRSLSIILDGKAYNIVDNPATNAVDELAVLDPAQQRFLLLRPAAAVACELTFQEMLQGLEAAREHIRGQMDSTPPGIPQDRIPLTRFLLKPTFQTTFDSPSARLEMTSEFLSYRVKGSPLTADALRPKRPILLASNADPALTPAEVMPSLQTYWDWHARLNRLLNRRALPPEVRLALNAELVKRQIVPDEVELQLLFDGNPRARSVHKVGWQLQRGDRGRIADLQKQLDAARRISFTEYVADLK